MLEPNHDDAIEALRAYNRFYTDRIGVLDRGYLETDHTLAEARVLYELGARGSTTAKALIDDLHLDAAYLSRILKKFRAAGLIDSRPDPADGRSQIVSATAAGRERFEKLGALSRRQLSEMLTHLGTAERAELTAATATIRRLLTADGSDRGPATIRAHRPGDIGWIVQSQAEFYTRACGWNDQFEALVAEVAGKFLANFDAAREHCWIAERHGVRVGSVLVMNGGGDVAKLRLLYVDAGARGIGLGRTLVDETIAFSRAHGYRQLTLWTNDILHAARHIYQTAGFRLVAEEKHSLFGPEENGQTWTLDL